jgi:osmoprotectant transport system ATP-binding protein
VTGAAEERLQPLIELRSVSRSFGRSVAVRGVDLAVARGEFLVILGESGSGKTTLLKMINRLQPPDSGDVVIDGQSTSAVVAHELRRRIGYVFQRVGLFPHMTVGENIAITPRLLGWDEADIRARVAELLVLVNLPAEMASRFPSALSGGQRQRVGVARALAARPAIMLMDEPFGALDPITRDTLGGEYRLLHERMGLSTVMVTHDVLEALLLADRLVVMHDGAIVASGTPHEMMNAQGDEGVRRLMDMPRRQMKRVAAMLDDERLR